MRAMCVEVIKQAYWIDIIYWKGGSMDEKYYINKLQAIREKYCSNAPVNYLPPQRHNPERYSPVRKAPPVRTDHSLPHRNIQTAQVKEDIVSHYRSINTHSSPTKYHPTVSYEPIPPSVFNPKSQPAPTPTHQRSHSFSALLKDIDTRIQHKEQVIKEMSHQHQSKRETHKEQYSTLAQPAHYPAPRKDTRTDRGHDRSRGHLDHELESLIHKKTEILNGSVEHKYTLRPTPPPSATHSPPKRTFSKENSSPIKKLRMEEKPGYSIGKLDSIQHRIKNVLQDAN